MSASLTERELRALPLFPLPNLVLFPGTTLALHVFEPRYRDMMADCLSRGPMAMAVAQLKPGWQADYHGRPAVYEIAGAGRIVSHLKQRDGTFDIQLEGCARVKLRELPADRSYRRAAGDVLWESMPDDGLPQLELTTLLTLASQIVEIVQRENPVARMQLLASLADEPARLLDKLADQFVADPETRQHLLETLDVQERLQLLKRCIADLHLSLVAAAGGDGGPSGDRVLH
jgi:Lon protease-like protein